MKILSQILLALIIISVSTSCEKKSNLNLDIDNAVFAFVDDNGSLVPEENTPTYYPGDSIIMVLVNVGEFDHDKEGYSSLSMQVEIKDEEGNLIMQDDALEAGQGRVQLQTGYLGSPYAVWQSTYEVAAGKYTFSVIVNDEINSNATRISKTFNIE